MTKSTQRKQSGVVALITSIVVGLLLVVITASGIALMGSELRQSSDYDQSIKAYYAAESGIEDAVAYLRRNGLGVIEDNDDCDTFLDQSGGINSKLLVVNGETKIEYTCQLVTTKDNQVTGELAEEAAAQIDLNGLNDPGFNKIRLSWNKPSAGDTQGWDPANFPSGSGFPAGNNWDDDPNPLVEGQSFPAIMEVTVVSYPTPGGGSPTFNADEIRKDTVVLRPGGNTSNAAIPTPPIQQPILANCNGTGEFSCSIELSGFASSRTFLISLHARYSPTNYKIEALTGSNQVLEIPGAQLTIDVTGKAGSVFRRVQAKAPLNPQADFPFFVLLADENICKVLEVLRTADIVSEGGEKGCPSL